MTLPDDIACWSSFAIHHLVVGVSIDRFGIGKGGTLFHVLTACAPHRPGEPHEHFDVGESADTEGPVPCQLDEEGGEEP